MAYNTKNILTDSAGRPIPQVWDSTADAFVPATDTIKVSAIPEVEIKNTSGDPIPVQGTVSVTAPTATQATLQSAATAVGNGTTFTVASNKTLMLSITGTATARTVVFEISDASGVFTEVQGYNMATGDLATSTSGTTNEKWQIPVEAATGFRARISAISGGDVTVKLTAVQ